MRITIVTESFLPRIDGVVRGLLELLGYLHSHDHQAFVFAPGPGPREYLGYEVRRVAGMRFPLYPDLTLAPYCPSMGKLLRA
jgi:phosphatidylinositol alpha 1,6-mannosyltransferase